MDLLGQGRDTRVSLSEFYIWRLISVITDLPSLGVYMQGWLVLVLEFRAQT
jgi:hypothetical protein